MGRKYVNRRKRDGEQRGRVAPIIDKSAIKAGASAHEKGEPRYVNPWVGDKARLWTSGWNKAHGSCEGCPMCSIGNKVPKKKSGGNNSGSGANV